MKISMLILGAAWLCLAPTRWTGPVDNHNLLVKFTMPADGHDGGGKDK